MNDDERSSGSYCPWPHWCAWPRSLEDALVADAVAGAAAGDAAAERWLMTYTASLLDAGVALPDSIRFWLAPRLVAGAAATGEHEFAAAFGVATPRRTPGRPRQSDAERLEAAMPLAAAVELLRRWRNLKKEQAVAYLAETCGADESTLWRHLSGIDYTPMQQLMPETPENPERQFRIRDDDLFALAYKRFGRSLALARPLKKGTGKN